MKSVPAVLLLATLCLVQAARPRREDGKFTTQYDNVNLDEILGNKRLLKSYFDCLMDKGNCSPDGQELKVAIPQALENECAACSDKQKEGVEKVIPHMMKHEPEMWEQLKNKYDPDNKYSERYDAYMKKAEEKNREKSV